MVNESDRVVVWIGVFKLAKVAVLLAIGIGALWFQGHDVAHHIRVWGAALGLDPGNQYLGRVASKVGVLSPARFDELGIGSLAYAVLFAVEGGGLVRRKVWAQYLTVAITASFLPLEIYEIVRHGSVVKVLITAVNVAIVVYLVWGLRRARRWPFRNPVR